jgi:SAM-dependent methyltransferase
MYVCPACRRPLEIKDQKCFACGFALVLNDSGSLIVADEFFPDHNHDAVVDALHRGEWTFYERDEFINAQFTEKFCVPLIRRIFGARKDVNILSVGCGVGADVKLLRQEGYNAWGTDCGSRCLFWSRLSQPEFLAQCTDRNLPFPTESFDFVMCHQVLEHVGVVGDSMVLQKAWFERRKEFIANIMRVVKKGGYFNIATPNRLFPLDPGHAPNFLGIRIHGPFDYFLTSYGDMRSYFSDAEVRPVTPYGYYAGTFASRAGVVGSAFNAYIRFLDRHPALQGTFLNPLANVLARKN